MDYKAFEPLVKKLKEGKKVSFFTGAGISTNAGIPDFRSPETGLYANLAKLNLPYAEAVFDIDYFRDDPKAFYTLAEELFPGKFKPTKFHYMIRLLQDKNLLQRVYTQNIDTLERIAGVKDEYIVEAHGSFASNHCIDCSHEMSTEQVIAAMADKTKNDGIPTCGKCQGYVKPDIVFFGEGLPSRLFELWDEDSETLEIAIVAGTSLTVYPFAGLHSEVGKDALRVLINNETVGDFKEKKRKSDIIALENADVAADMICELLGWKDELDLLYGSNIPKESAEEKAREIADEIKLELQSRKDRDDKEESEVKREDFNDSEDDTKSEDFKDASEEDQDELEKEIAKLKI